MTKLFIIQIITVIFSVLVLAHDGGHGPKLTDTAKLGGIVAPLMDAKNMKNGAKMEVAYKAELVRSEDGTARIYLYDKAMNPLDLTKFDKTANGVVEFKKNKKWKKLPFTLSQEEGCFAGKAPKANAKPFNIDIIIKEGTRELFVAFDNLD